MVPQSMGSETNIKLPFSFIFYSLAALIVSQILLLSNVENLINGNFRIPAIWSAAHLFILGWALMVAMGAMYQLVPVAFLTPIWNEKFGYVQFLITATGITWFAVSLYLSPQEALIPGLLTLLGVLMFLFQMLMTLREQAKPNILTLFVGSALCCLLLTILLGGTMIYSLKTGFATDHYQAIFQSHVLLGTTGWFTLLIFGFSYKMVPMFSLSHGYPMIHAKYVYGIYLSGTVLTVTSFLVDSPILLKFGIFLLFAGYSVFAWHISIIIKKRIKKKLDKPFSFALSAISFGLVIHFVAFILLWTNGFSSLIGPLLYLYLLVWIALSILGYLYKIVPFLWWTYKYSKEIGKKQVPSLKEMMNEKLAVPFLSLYILSACGICVAFIIKNQVLFTLTQGLLSSVFILMSISIISVIKK
jgi:hypothetical protein